MRSDRLVFTGGRSVGGSGGEGGSGETDTLVGGVEHAVEALEEDLSIDEVETLARRGADVVNDEVDSVGIAANGGVQGTL